MDLKLDKISHYLESSSHVCFLRLKVKLCAQDALDWILRIVRMATVIERIRSTERVSTARLNNSNR